MEASSTRIFSGARLSSASLAPTSSGAREPLPPDHLDLAWREKIFDKKSPFSDNQDDFERNSLKESLRNLKTSETQPKT